MKNLESMLRFWNMAGNKGDPVYSGCFIKLLKSKANLDCFIEINWVGFDLIEFTGLGPRFPSQGTFFSGTELPTLLWVAS